MSNIPRPHEIYKHFKGNLYQITAVAEHTETGEMLVVYQALYGDFKTYARPLEMFMEKVDKGKYPDAMQEYRFELQNGDGARQGEIPKESNKESDKESDKESQRVETGKMTEQPVEESAAEQAEELDLDPMVLKFLDASTYEERLNILSNLKTRVTDDMITIMAVACDIEVPEGAIEDRYNSLKNCLVTMEKYECNRLR